MIKIPVTKSFTPPLSEYSSQVKRAFDNNWLSNRGELVLDLEKKLKDFLEVSNILLTCNGTLPIQIALKAFGNKGEIITTPFSYVATTSSIVWEGCKPVFVDIDPNTFTIDSTKIEQAITPRTTCILATHVFGNPCNVEAIEEIANNNNLKVIYDAAHCFGVEYKGKSLFEYGDVSTCSFHATKIFHTAEGGGIFVKDSELYKKLYYLHNFGHNGPLEFVGLGTNAKMSELNAAMGLSILPYFKSIVAERKLIVEKYSLSVAFKGITLRDETKWNYSYYPILLPSEEVLLKLELELFELGICPRRYFYPPLNSLPYVNKVSFLYSDDISSRVLCLPLYCGLKEEDQNKIINIINKYA